MTDTVHRTEDWARLRHSGFLTVEDQPDRITITNIIDGWPMFMMGWQALMGALAVLSILSLVVNQSPMTYILTCLFIGLMMRGILTYWPLYLTTAHKIAFTPDEIQFFGLFGNDLGILPRVSMQQIAVGDFKAGKHTVSYHHFMADTGWVKAMPTFHRDNVLVRNNILMSAFAQPLHLFSQNKKQENLSECPMVPQVTGLSRIIANHRE